MRTLKIVEPKYLASLFSRKRGRNYPLPPVNNQNNNELVTTYRGMIKTRGVTAMLRIGMECT